MDQVLHGLFHRDHFDVSTAVLNDARNQGLQRGRFTAVGGPHQQDRPMGGDEHVLDGRDLRRCVAHGLDRAQGLGVHHQQTNDHMKIPRGVDRCTRES